MRSADLMAKAAKEIKVTEHPDGRKDVKISVNRLDVDAQDQATKDAKEVIENKVLPKLAETPVLVILIHKPTGNFASKYVALKHVRAFAEAAIEKLKKDSDDPIYVCDMIIVEHHLQNGQVKVTTL